MPEARRELLDAATSHASSGESRLTEVLAAVLATHDEFASALMRKVGLPVGERFEVVTQQRVAPGCIVDMVLRSSRSGGAPVSQLWSEHKTILGFRHEQREDYARALGARPGEGRLLTITPAHTDQAQGSWARMTWQELAELANAVERVRAPSERLRTGCRRRLRGASTSRSTVRRRFAAATPPLGAGPGCCPCVRCSAPPRPPADRGQRTRL